MLIRQYCRLAQGHNRINPIFAANQKNQAPKGAVGFVVSIEFEVWIEFVS